MLIKNVDIHPSAKIADDVEIGPWSVIGADVEIDSGTWIGPHVVIKGPTKIGKNNKIFQFASIGDAPQDLTYAGEATTLEIGDNNTIREYCVINRGTLKGGGTTRIGDHNFLMVYAHVGHDCMVGNHTILTNCSALSGHVEVGDYTIIGAYAAVHQFCVLGEHCFVAKASYVTKDVMPYIIVSGHTPTACGINATGLKRRGFSRDALENLRRAYRVVFRSGFTVQKALEELTSLATSTPEVRTFVAALENSSRGIVR